ncbi:zinc finger BED domain-containing protein RICESLEEPER 2-like protein [Tanacetum coccineum]
MSRQSTEGDNEDEASSTTLRRQRSLVWSCFEKIEGATPADRTASCHNCGKVYCANPGSGTRNLKRHMLKYWGIKDKVFTITLDNAKYNDGLVETLRSHLRLNNVLVCDGKFIHVRCGAHVLNLIVEAGLKVIEGSIEKVSRDWCESNIEEAIRNSDPVISDMGKDMKTKFDKYWNDYCKVLSFTVIMDSRYKDKIIDYCFSKLEMTSEVRQEKVDDIVHSLHEFYKDYEFNYETMHDSLGDGQKG